jgi:hypothetical protein
MFSNRLTKSFFMSLIVMSSLASIGFAAYSHQAPSVGRTDGAVEQIRGSALGPSYTLHIGPRDGAEQIRGSDLGPAYTLPTGTGEAVEQIRGSNLGPSYTLHMGARDVTEQIRGSQLGPSYSLYIQGTQPLN